MDVNRNIGAFLDMLALSEGTSTVKGSDNGYNVLYGGGLFHSYADHPRKTLTFTIKGKRVTSTAAGRYQILARFFDAYKKQLNLPDFSPESQDKIALQLIKECRATDDIIAGRIHDAIYKCRSRWASLPGAGYGQHEHKLETLVDAYIHAGGKVAS